MLICYEAVSQFIYGYIFIILQYMYYVLSLEKHKVILHELSFEDNHRLKAPELLCPVFLAVQEDDEFEEKRKKKMSQSIDDLCEMISEDSEDDQGMMCRHPLPYFNIPCFLV